MQIILVITRYCDQLVLKDWFKLRRIDSITIYYNSIVLL